MPSHAYIGIGSNLDNPIKQVLSAISHLQQAPSITVEQVSPWYKSRAIGPVDEPDYISPDYINGVVHISTTLSPIELLNALQTIENAHHRERTIRWGARTLDLDILLFDDITLNTERLTLPHPELLNRNFVLYPLTDVAPAIILPNNMPLRVFINQVTQEGLWPLAS